MDPLELRALVSPSVAAEIRSALADAPFGDGSPTAHGRAREAKRNEQLDPSHPKSVAQGARLLDALARCEPFRAFAVPHTILPFTFARYLPGMRYGDHIDLPVVGTRGGPLRTDLSITVFLGEPGAYAGGELVVGAQGRAFKGAMGDALIYPSDTVHRVEAVTGGERLVAITWVQSLLRDSADRALLAELGAIESSLRAAGAPEGELLRLSAIQGQLLRRWVNV